jgi:hypothetical protein
MESISVVQHPPVVAICPLSRLRERRLAGFGERVRVFCCLGVRAHPHPARWRASRLSRKREREIDYV